MNYKILVAEDEPDIQELLKLYLETAGYTVLAAKNGEDALKIFKEQKIDIALVDIMMPIIDGFGVIEKIRETSNVPIVAISAKGQDGDKIAGLNLGADDYITKPFNPIEVLARVNSALRRFYKLGGEVKGESFQKDICLGELRLDTEKVRLWKNNTEIFITPAEYKILLKFMKSPGRVFAKAQLYESINGEYFKNDDSTMMVHISNLREKIEDDPKKPRYIKTIRGIGYKIEAGK